MRVLDLFCGAGGTGYGVHLAMIEAGIDATVIGHDIDPQPRYPFEFHRSDAVSVLGDLDYVRSFDIVIAGPPCKVHTSIRHTIRSGARRKHPVNLIPITRHGLRLAGVPFVIENVVGAPLLDPIVLCGSMFSLGVRRHRLFEVSGFEVVEPRCRHREQEAGARLYPVKRYHSGGPVTVWSPIIGVYGHGQGTGEGEVDRWREAMSIPWMNRDELSQAIPPAYSKYLGQQFLAGRNGAVA